MDPILLGMIKKTGKPTDAQVSTAVNAYLADNPVQAYDDTEIKENLVDLNTTVGYYSNYVTPQMYGAVGDGVADDTQAIKTAMQNSKYVFFPLGIYRITSTITLNGRVTLFGQEGSYVANMTGVDSMPKIKVDIPYTEGSNIIGLNGNGMFMLSNLIIEADYINITHDYSKVGTEESPYTTTRTTISDSTLAYGINSSGSHSCIQNCIIKGFTTGLRGGGYHSLNNVTFQSCVYGVQGLVDANLSNIRIQECETGLDITGAGSSITNVRMDNISTNAIAINATGVNIVNVFADMVGKELIYLKKDAEGCSVINIQGRAAVLSAGRDIMATQGVGALINDGGKNNKIQFNYKHYVCPDGGSYKTPKYLIRSSSLSTGTNFYDIVYEEVPVSTSLSSEDLQKIVYIYSSYPFNSVVTINGIRYIFSNTGPTFSSDTITVV